MENLLSILLHSITQTHVFHLQTKSYAEHIALNEFYDGMGGLVDRLAEGYQGKYGVQKYKNISGLENYESKEQVIEYLLKLDILINSNKPEEGFLLAIIDDIQELLYTTKYKLENLT